ncbi:Uncharacterised protein [Legionella busanensis]|uniref:Haem-binding uptake Tiki superfamily ChaN domain-containing protein n=1 Tax=Legionella busanensis TaxID=190655 RepID=A0A378JJL3_9GAMM|nr:hypothetical protein [Legionella busanensis]STX51257.1 Uncharacterised protein [Legionella busanensis]
MGKSKIDVSSLSIFSKSLRNEQHKKRQLTREFYNTIERNQSSETPGIFIYENHDHKFPKEFLIANFKYFKSLGIQTLFWEFSQVEQQELLNKYNSSSPSARPPATLEINARDKELYADIIYAAHQAGIRIVGLDSNEARKNSHPDPYYLRHPSKQDWDDYLKEREDRFDKSAVEIIKKEHNNRPYLCYLGFGHNRVQSLLGPTYSAFLIDGDYLSKSQSDKDYLDEHRGNANIFVYSTSLNNNPSLLNVTESPGYSDVILDSSLLAKI